MRYQGKIVDWNDARGFGFVVPNGGGEKVFVHISLFSQAQQRPRANDNDAVFYEVKSDAQGRVQATNVKLPVTAPSGRAVDGRVAWSRGRARRASAPWLRVGCALAGCLARDLGRHCDNAVAQH